MQETEIPPPRKTDLRCRLHRLQSLNNTRVSQSGHITKILSQVSRQSQLPQNSAHNLPTPRLRQTRSPMNRIRSRKRTNDGPHFAHKLLLQAVNVFLSLHQSHVAVNALPLDLVREANHSGFSDLRMRDQSRLDLCRPDAVPRHIDHIIHAPGQKVIPILVALATVARKIVALELTEIRLLETRVVPKNGSHDRGERLFYH
mmetsp:Transcript_56967/g.131071  ORF Transcript_56967/g.131071 Transcript_56967/m.131071 type:complete len:201 (-) Transcript_56967:194-796(-)